MKIQTFMLIVLGISLVMGYSEMAVAVDNDARSSQTAAGDNLLGIDQDGGSGNKVSMVQEAYGGGNIAGILQLQDSNSAHIEQLAFGGVGSGNMLTINQSFDNSIELKQESSIGSNSATIMQDVMGSINLYCIGSA